MDSLVFPFGMYEGSKTIKQVSEMPDGHDYLNKMIPYMEENKLDEKYPDFYNQLKDSVQHHHHHMKTADPNDNKDFDLPTTLNPELPKSEDSPAISAEFDKPE